MIKTVIVAGIQELNPDALARPLVSTTGRLLVDGGKVTLSDNFTVGLASFTATGPASAVDFTALGLGACSKYSLQVKGNVPANSWEVALEVSLDGTNFTEVLRHVGVGAPEEEIAGNPDGAVVFTEARQLPALYMRATCNALELGSATAIAVTILAMK